MVGLITGEEYKVCETCHTEIEYMRVWMEEIEDDIRHGEEELEDAMGSHGIFHITSFW